MLLRSMKLIKYNLQTPCLLKSSFGHTIVFIVVPKAGLLLILRDYYIFCRFDYNVLDDYSIKYLKDLIGCLGTFFVVARNTFLLDIYTILHI